VCLAVAVPLAIGGWAMAAPESLAAEGPPETETPTEPPTKEEPKPEPEPEPEPPPPPPKTPPPTLAVNQPATPSTNTTPSFSGKTSGGSGSVTVVLYEGNLSKHREMGRLTAKVSGESWSTGKVSPALANGEYGVVAVQENVTPGDGKGESSARLFTVDVPPPPAPTPAPTPAPVSPTKTTTSSTTAPASVATGTSAAVSHPGAPVAQFKWFPAVPQTGEPVSLVSISTDVASPITGTAWALLSNGPFQAGAVLLTTSFSTPGGHVVRLRVTNASGVSSVATETINVVSASAQLMQPFPVVRIAGTETSFGVRLGALRVAQLPAGAKVTVRCKGHGCPIKFATRVAKAGTRGVTPVEFPRFERGLRFGVVLEIMVSKPGEIGKYTRFVVRRGKLPERVDMCLNPAGALPFVCPSS
jgi:hypothetical protein